MPIQRSNCAAEFKVEAVKQVICKGHAVADLAKRLGIPEEALFDGANKFKKSDAPQPSDLKALLAELAKLKSALRQAHQRQFRLFSSFRVLKVHRSGARVTA